MRKLVYKAMAVFLLTAIITAPNFAYTNTSPKATINTAPIAKKEFTRTINKEYDIAADGIVGMHNKYGKVDIKTWDKNQVKATVTITVNASNESKADEMFERINVAFENGNDFVKGQTTIESTKKGWMSSWWNDSGNSEFTIDYEVFMPASCNLDLSNKYGHSTVASLEGKASVTVKYGDIRMDGLGGDLELDVGYGNATITNSRDVSALIKYGKLRVETARDVKVESKYSKVYITKAADIESVSKYDTYRLGEVQDLRNQGKYDDFEIDRANAINVASRYSDFDIQHLIKKAKFEMEYGGLTIEDLAKNFAKVEVKARYTNIKIDIQDGAQYDMDIATTHAGIRYPDEADINYNVQRSSSHEVKGSVGAKGSNSLVYIRTDYGNVKLY